MVRRDDPKLNVIMLPERMFRPDDPKLNVIMLPESRETMRQALPCRAAEDFLQDTAAWIPKMVFLTFKVAFNLLRYVRIYQTLLCSIRIQDYKLFRTDFLKNYIT